MVSRKKRDTKEHLWQGCKHDLSTCPPDLRYGYDGLAGKLLQWVGPFIFLGYPAAVYMGGRKLAMVAGTLLEHMSAPAEAIIPVETVTPGIDIPLEMEPIGTPEGTTQTFHNAAFNPDSVAINPSVPIQDTTSLPIEPAAQPERPVIQAEVHPPPRRNPFDDNGALLHTTVKGAPHPELEMREFPHLTRGDNYVPDSLNVVMNEGDIVADVDDPIVSGSSDYRIEGEAGVRSSSPVREGAIRFRTGRTRMTQVIVNNPAFIDAIPEWHGSINIGDLEGIDLEPESLLTGRRGEVAVERIGREEGLTIRGGRTLRVAKNYAYKVPQIERIPPIEQPEEIEMSLFGEGTGNVLDEGFVEGEDTSEDFSFLHRTGLISPFGEGRKRSYQIQEGFFPVPVPFVPPEPGPSPIPPIPPSPYYPGTYFEPDFYCFPPCKRKKKKQLYSFLFQDG